MSIIVFISSVINTTNEPLTYTKTRSVFTADQRYEQTLQSIASVRKHLPTARILLVESSPLTEDQTRGLQEKVEFFLNIVNDPFAKDICMNSPKKGFGEAIQTYFAIQFLQTNSIPFDKFFKLSGRYSLTDRFNPQSYSDTEFTFYRRASSNPLSISTVVFSVPFSLFSVFSNAVTSVIQVYFHVESKGYEEALPPLCLPRIEIQEIGVEGLVSVNGEYFSC